MPGPNVLIVDDVSDVPVSVSAFRTGAGFVVSTVTKGNATPRPVASGKLISVLVTDFAMPGLSGVDLINQATQIRPASKRW